MNALAAADRVEASGEPHYDADGVPNPAYSTRGLRDANRTTRGKPNVNRPSQAVIAFTGHRPDIFREPDLARATVERLARELQPMARRFLVGGQRGVDTWAAQAAITLGVPFTLILPIGPARFAADWSAEDRSMLDATLARAEDVQVAGTFSERNRRLATNADLLVAVWTGIGGGGTAETLALAEAAQTPIREVRLAAAPGADSARGRGI